MRAYTFATIPWRISKFEMRIMAYVFVLRQNTTYCKKQWKPFKHKILPNRTTVYRTALSHTHVHLGNKKSVANPRGWNYEYAS